jgi:hypothetical protein
LIGHSIKNRHFTNTAQQLVSLEKVVDIRYY